MKEDNNKQLPCCAIVNDCLNDTFVRALLSAIEGSKGAASNGDSKEDLESSTLDETIISLDNKYYSCEMRLRCFPSLDAAKRALESDSSAEINVIFVVIDVHSEAESPFPKQDSAFLDSIRSIFSCCPDAEKAIVMRSTVECEPLSDFMQHQVKIIERFCQDEVLELIPLDNKCISPEYADWSPEERGLLGVERVIEVLHIAFASHPAIRKKKKKTGDKAEVGLSADAKRNQKASASKEKPKESAENETEASKKATSVEKGKDFVDRCGYPDAEDEEMIVQLFGKGLCKDDLKRGGN